MAASSLNRFVPRLVQLLPTLTGNFIISRKPAVYKGSDLVVVEVRYLHFGELLKHVLICRDTTAQNKLVLAVLVREIPDLFDGTVDVAGDFIKPIQEEQSSAFGEIVFNVR